MIEEFYQTKTNKSVPFSNDIKRNALALLNKEYPDLTRIQGQAIIKKCANKCRDNINILLGKKTSAHSSIKKLYDVKKNSKNNPKHNPKNNPKNNLKKKLRAAEEILCECFKMDKKKQCFKKRKALGHRGS